MDGKQIAQTMETQLPEQWYLSQWYPARLPNGNSCEIMQTEGVGRNSGRYYLHVRREVPLVVVYSDGEREKTNLTDYLHVRINLSSGEIKTL